MFVTDKITKVNPDKFVPVRYRKTKGIEAKKSSDGEEAEKVKSRKFQKVLKKVIGKDREIELVKAKRKKVKGTRSKV